MGIKNNKQTERGSSDPTSLVLTILIGGALYYTGMWVIDYMWAEKEDRRKDYVEYLTSDRVVRDDMGYDLN